MRAPLLVLSVFSLAVAAGAVEARTASPDPIGDLIEEKTRAPAAAPPQAAPEPAPAPAPAPTRRGRAPAPAEDGPGRRDDGRRPSRDRRQPARPAAPAPTPQARPAAPPPLSVAGLRGVDPDTVRKRLGEPALAREELGGALWTYRLPACALFVMFRKEGPASTVSGVSAGPLRRGEAAPEPDVCLAGARTP